MLQTINKRCQIPYSSNAQRKLFHAKLARGEISKSTVDEYDKASKGKKLPEYKGSKFSRLKKHLGMKE